MEMMLAKEGREWFWIAGREDINLRLFVNKSGTKLKVMKGEQEYCFDLGETVTVLDPYLVRLGTSYSMEFVFSDKVMVIDRARRIMLAFGYDEFERLCRMVRVKGRTIKDVNLRVLG